MCIILLGFSSLESREVIFKHENRLRYANYAISLRLDAPLRLCVGVDSVQLSPCFKDIPQVEVAQGFHFSGDTFAPNNRGIRSTINVIDGHPPGLVRVFVIYYVCTEPELDRSDASIVGSLFTIFSRGICQSLLLRFFSLSNLRSIFWHGIILDQQF